MSARTIRHTPNKLRVALIAPPWYKLPPSGYGGTENVISALIPELIKLGLDVEVFTTGDSKIEAVKKHWLYEKEQSSFVHSPQYESAAIAAAHMLYSLNYVKTDGKFDIIHDHNTIFGPLATAFADDSLPPVITTLHNPRFIRHDSTYDEQTDYLPLYEQLAQSKKIHFVCISQSQAIRAPANLRQKLLPVVYHGINLKEFPFSAKKSDYFITLSRHHPEKGQHIAVKACLDLGYKLKLAGVVGDISSYKDLMHELVNPRNRYRTLADFRYFKDKIFPYLDGNEIEYVGEVTGKRKTDLIKNAKALLFPIQWEEPFGMAPIEALACGTPVVAMRRGALPEIIEHGVNGFLANNQREFKYYMTRVDDIDPRACRESIKHKFTSAIMAKNYLKQYRSVINLG